MKTAAICLNQGFKCLSNMQSNIWRTIPLLRNPIFLSQFHSTSILLAKSKNDKAQIRFAVRQKRADTKKAVKDFLLYGKASKLCSLDANFNRSGNETNNRKGKARGPVEGSKAFKSQPSFEKGKKSSRRHRQRFYDTDDEAGPDNFFSATFGGQKCYTWSFTWTENLDFSNTRSQFNYENGKSKKEKVREKFWRESDDEEESTNVYSVGSYSHRITLGLPPTGPLKLEAIKTAYRESALKWHPDKHRGASQAMAEEKFKLCVEAYNSLCNAVKAT